MLKTGPRLRQDSSPGKGGYAGGETADPVRKATSDEPEEILTCAHCGSFITKSCWRIATDGFHERVVFNPAGMVFRIGSFKEAPGVREIGEESAEFSWFKNYRWRIVICDGCSSHLGWRFHGSATPALFYALVLPRLTPKT